MNAAIDLAKILENAASISRNGKLMIAKELRRLHAENEALRAENEALRADAGRYSWVLKQQYDEDSNYCIQYWSDGNWDFLVGVDLSKLIDEEMGQSK